MRRSLLFIPSNNPAMLQNADVFGSDSVIFDLEDAVNVTEKDNARNLLYYYLKEHDKLNNLSTESNRSRNELIGILLAFAMKYCEISDDNSSHSNIDI